MSYNTNAKVNPFYIQDDEEDPWDDDYGDEDCGDEQVKLMSRSGGTKNRMYNDTSARSNDSDRRHTNNSNSNSTFSGSYHDDQFKGHDRHLQHRPQLWKYGFLLFTIVGAVVFGSSHSSENDGNSDSNVSLSSLIDEIPNTEISTNEYRIVVLGERHSGTAWMRERLRECFPHVEVSNGLQRMGYFFQDDEETARSKEETLTSNNPNTIVVHVTLNIYDWLEQMRLSPEYAPNHVGKHEKLDHLVPLDWEEFLSKPWTTERPQTDLPLANETGSVCQMGFHYNEVVSCSQPVGGIDDPMYELRPEDGDGRPFESIIDLRTAKLKNHHSVLQSWPSVKKMIQVSYETTAQDFKTKLLHEILDFTGWNGGSYDHNGVSLPCSGNVLPPSLDSSKEMTLEFIDFVTDRADWDTEEDLASYVQWTESEIAAKGIRSEKSTTPDSVEEDIKTEKAANADIDTTQEETDTVGSSDQPSPPSSNEASEEKFKTAAENESKETKAKENNSESSSSSSSGNSSSSSSENVEDDSKTTGSDATNDNSKSTSAVEHVSSSASASSSEQKTIEESYYEDSPPPPSDSTNNNSESTSTAEKDDSSTSASSSEQKMIEETDEEELFYPPPAKEEPNNEKKSESSTDDKESPPPPSDVTNGNSQSTSAAEKDDSSASSSISENKIIEEDEKIPLPSYPTKEQPSSEKKSESSKAAGEEAPAHSDESGTEDKNTKETDESSKDSTKSTSYETEEEKLSSAKSPDQDKESDASVTAPIIVDATSEGASDTAVASESDTAKEGKMNSEKEAPSDDNTKSNEETLTAETNEEKNEEKEKPPSEPTSGEEETSVQNDKASDIENEKEAESDGKRLDYGNEKETEGDGDVKKQDREKEKETEIDSKKTDNENEKEMEGDGKKQDNEIEKETKSDGKSTDVNKDVTETEASVSNSEEDHAADNAKSKNDENDDKQ